MAVNIINPAFYRQANHMKQLLNQSAVNKDDLAECRMIVEDVAEDLGTTFNATWNLFQDTVGEPLHI